MGIIIEIIKELNVEVSSPNLFQAVVAKQYDMNTRFIKATFVDNGDKIYIDPDATVKVVINALRQDGESKGFDGVVNSDGTVTVPLHSWMLEQEGTVICDISVIDTETNDNKKLTTTSFTLFVEKAAWGGNGITSDPQYDLLIDLLNSCEVAVEACEDATERCLEVINSGLAEESKAEIVATVLATEKITQMAQDIADLKYYEIKVTSFINSEPGPHEMGAVIKDVYIAWELNKEPTKQALESNIVGNDLRMMALTNQNITTDQTYSLVVTDERGAIDGAYTYITFHNGVYYGVLDSGAAIDNAAILGLNRKLQGSKGITFAVNAAAGKNIVYAIPSRYGTPNFNVGGFDGGFSKVSTINFTNASGYAEDYDVWVSDNAGLGSTTVKVS